MESGICSGKCGKKLISGFHTSAFLGNDYNLVAWTFYGNKNEPSTHCVKYVHNKQIWLYFQIPMHSLFMCLFTYISLSWLEYEKHQFHGSLQFSVKKFKTVIWKSCASRSRCIKLLKNCISLTTAKSNISIKIEWHFKDV